MANIRSIDYKGFNHATGSSGIPGFMFWSGSVDLSAGDVATAYNGLGFEIIRDSGSFLKFSTEPSEFIVRTENFYLGNTNQFISGSNGNIEISSSNFHVSPGGLVTATNFSEKIVTVTDANSSSYFEDHGTTGVKLTLDGSLGGTLAMNLQLNVAPYNATAGAIKPITDITLPLQAEGELAKAKIIINTDNVTFNDGTVAQSWANMTK
jgi:hypothetical protein